MEFTLQDEARTTAHRSSVWSSDSRLRHQPVIFVSTGATEPLKQLEGILEESIHEASLPHPVHDSTTDNTAPSNIRVDPVSQRDHTCLDEAKLRNTISRHDQRESEISPTQDGLTPQPFFIDVTGDRNFHHTQNAAGVLARSQSPADSDSSEEVILFRGRNKAAKTTEKPFNLGRIHTEIRVLEETVNSTGDDSVFFDPRCTRKRATGSQQDARSIKLDEESELIADYVANLREHDEDGNLKPADAFSHRDLGGFSHESDSSEEARRIPKALANPVALTDADSEADSTTVDSDFEPAAGKNVPVDDLPPVALVTVASCFASLEHSHTDEASPHSAIISQGDDEDDIFTAAADRFAKEADDFDFMDWDRPSLKPKKGKGAKGRVPIFDVSDSELEGKMQAAWKNDRLKKAERKKQRQALRAQGLLGKHANPDDLRVKYPNGMALDEIADELRTFLLGSQATLILPPMNNHARKAVHELASKFNIKSKSTGSGDQRRPMLHRTLRTTRFAEESFNTAIARVSRKYFPRNDAVSRAAVQRQSTRRAGGHAGVNYRDGEVVGGSAPELSQENKGRAMLEKMGWSNGTALGALNNKGILQPVAHVVKRSKAGLG
ncbi:G-patch domain-containing protein [Colletotrichum plurivorum]|uniref:Protein SQS1 n=1 Tax=Colletotrichum plurivorum TaxID=2175906 RepID=A0A8H6JH89_9PEZI|nr:G-patch domain-containing protein [Colletotrichum plurivorum]